MFYAHESTFKEIETNNNTVKNSTIKKWSLFSENSKV